MVRYTVFANPGKLRPGEWVTWLQNQRDQSSRPVLLQVTPRIQISCSICFGAGRIAPATGKCSGCANIDPDPLTSINFISYSFHDGLESIVATNKRSYFPGMNWLSDPMGFLLLAWLNKHGPCLRTQAGGDFIVTRVPSATDSIDHLARIWDRTNELSSRFPLKSNLLLRVIGAGKPARQTIEPQHYRVDGSLAGKSVVLIDDIYTSGASIRSAAQRLKDAGASSVVGVVLGRTLNETPFGNNLELCTAVAERTWSIDECTVCRIN